MNLDRLFWSGICNHKSQHVGKISHSSIESITTTQHNYCFSSPIGCWIKPFRTLANIWTYETFKWLIRMSSHVKDKYRNILERRIPPVCGLHWEKLPRMFFLSAWLALTFTPCSVGYVSVCSGALGGFCVPASLWAPLASAAVRFQTLPAGIIFFSANH